MPPVVSIVGTSKSGKTTVIEKLVQELKSRGYQVATIKHIPQGVDFDELGKDSWRHIQVGSETTAVSSPDKIVLIKPVVQESTIDEVASLLGEEKVIPGRLGEVDFATSRILLDEYREADKSS